MFSLGITVFFFVLILLRREPASDTLSQITNWGVIHVVLVTFWHYILLLQSLSLSVNSLVREHTGQTWDALILTGVDARRVARGKWQAVVR